MKAWLKKQFPSRKDIQDSKVYKKLKSSFKASCYWSRDRQAIARGIAAGLASCVIPGFQFFYAALLVVILQGNVPAALLFTFVSNPLTAVPITYFVYYVGKWLIGQSKNGFVPQAFHWDFSSFHAFWHNLQIWSLQFGKAFLIGLPLVSLCFGLLGYFGTLLIWRIMAFLHKKKGH